MSHHVRPEPPVLCGSLLADKSRSLHRQILIERQKLESLIIRQYEKGAYNLGLDIGVLKQSNLLDKLLFEIMTLENARSER